MPQHAPFTLYSVCRVGHGSKVGPDDGQPPMYHGPGGPGPSQQQQNLTYPPPQPAGDQPVMANPGYQAWASASGQPVQPYYGPPGAGMGYPPYPYAMAPPPPQQQQQQQQQQVVVIGGNSRQEPIPVVVADSYCGHMVFACFVFWCCNWLLGLIAFILAGKLAILY